MDVSIGWVFKGLQALHLNLAAQRCVFFREGFSLVCQAVAGMTQVTMTKVTRNVLAGVLQGVYQVMPFIPLNKLISWFTCLGLDLFHTQLVFTILLFQPMEPHDHVKASNHYIISNLMHQFYYSTPFILTV